MTVVVRVLVVATMYVLLSWYADALMPKRTEVKYVQGPMVCGEDELATWVDAPHVAECVNVEQFIREETED